MRNAALISASLHVAVLTLAYFGLPVLFERKPAVPEPVVVELVTLSETPSKPQKTARRAPAPEPPPEPEAGPPPAPPEPPPAPEPEAAAPPPEPVPAAEPVREPKPKPKLKPVPRPKPQVKVAKLAPKPKRKPPPPPDAFETLLRNLAKQANREREEPQPPATDRQVAAIEPEPPQMTELERRRLTMTIAQMVIRQITPCWSIPAGAKDADTMQVGIRIALNPDGSLRGVPRVEDDSRLKHDLAFRAVAESAVRALRDPRCSPLRLPIKNYDVWKEITFNFDPREMLGK